MGLSGSFNDFLGVLSVQGTATAVADGIAVKTAKFVTGNFIPVVGRMFTEAADTVISASGLLKNTVGIIGLVILCLIVAFPAIQIFVSRLFINSQQQYCNQLAEEQLFNV